MKIPVLSFFMVTLMSAASAQIDDLINSKLFNWSIWEVRMEEEERKAFLDNAKIPASGKMEDLKIIDVDGDGVSDIMFSGVSNTGKQTILYHNNGETFEEIFKVNEELINITRTKPWRPIQIMTKDEDCCDNNNYIIRTYIPGYNDEKLSYVAEHDIIINKNLSLIYENLPPFKFRIEAVPELRASADSVRAGFVLKMYQVGDFGYAVASKQGHGARTYWLVLVREDEHLLRAGWMRSKYLKKMFR